MDHTLNERTQSTVSADKAVIIQWIWFFFVFGVGKRKKEREIGIHSFICSYTLLSSADNNKSFQTKLFLLHSLEKGGKKIMWIECTTWPQEPHQFVLYEF
jgi:hypothetical protein